MGIYRLSYGRPRVDADIAELHQKENSATEEDFRNVLRKYNLRDGLISLGRASRLIFDTEDEKKIGKVVYRDPSTGIILSQIALGYLANILLVSGANDYRAKSIDGASGLSRNLLALCNSYSNCLVDPTLTKDGELINQDRFRSFMIRMHFEQMQSYQFWPAYLMARTFIIFGELIEHIQPDKSDLLSIIFQRKTGLSLREYLHLCFLVSAGAKTATFSITTFTKADIPHLKALLTEEKITRFLSILKSDYGEFRKEDKNVNDNLDPIFTKTRFNPLVVYPIIETDKKPFGEDPYIIPNITLYMKRAYGGIYWWFHRHFESQGRQQDFRNYFGHVFQEYVGIILKGIYGRGNVHGEISYGKDQRKFIDWWVERNDRIYLFESKAYQFALLSMQTGDKETVIGNEVRKKIASAIEQVYKRIQDIPNYQELEVFRQKVVVPFIVFMDIPFVSSNIYEPWIKQALLDIEREKQITDLGDFSVFLMNIEELELYDGCIDAIELDDIFPRLKGIFSESFLSILEESKGESLHNQYLDEAYKDFGRQLINKSDSEGFVRSLD